MKSKIYPLPFALKHHDVFKKREDVFLEYESNKNLQAFIKNAWRLKYDFFQTLQSGTSG